MKAIVTGMNGTVAPVVAERLQVETITVVAWDRERVPIDNHDAIRNFITEQKPAWFFHIATGSPRWAEAVAEICHKQKIRFLFTGSVSVFSQESQGPFSTGRKPDATDDYGCYKIECERRVRSANPEAFIARLGWQIGENPGSNNMVDFLTKTMAEKGKVAASSRWIPSCAFLQDTADALFRLMRDSAPDLYHLEGNPGLSFFDIAGRLNRKHGRKWKIVESDTPQWDNRMKDDRIPLIPITDRLPT